MTISIREALAKNRVRNKFSILRSTLPVFRRVAAEEKVAELAKLHFPKILSFSSNPDEINLWLLNGILAEQNRLLLPRVQGKALLIYEVTDLKSQLIKSRFKILEPDPNQCKLIDCKKIPCVLVPGLAFDKSYHRIGYGGGYFDRFLRNISCAKIGVGFFEQLSLDLLPACEHDVPVDRLFLC